MSVDVICDFNRTVRVDLPKDVEIPRELCVTKLAGTICPYEFAQPTGCCSAVKTYKLSNEDLAKYRRT